MSKQPSLSSGWSRRRASWSVQAIVGQALLAMLVGIPSASAQTGPCDAPSTCTIWPSSPVPGTPAVGNDPNPVELGVKFRTAVNGYITAIRFYKGATNTGAHVVNLWTGTGTLLSRTTAVN